MTKEFEDMGHEKGNKECHVCWSGYPKTCECGGLIHSHFGDYDSEDNYYLVTECDSCEDRDYEL